MDGVLERELITPATVFTLLALWVGYRLLCALYNISPFHPLAHIPGRKLAAASEWYQTYYDLVKGGRYCWEIRDMHAQYGIIFRVFPPIHPLHPLHPSNPPL
jgi:hypothetical protein